MAVSPPLPGMLHIPLVYIRAFALVSHVACTLSVGATAVSLYEDEDEGRGRSAGSRVISCNT